MHTIMLLRAATLPGGAGDNTRLAVGAGGQVGGYCGPQHCQVAPVAILIREVFPGLLINE